jgi:AcrR family transcriptional regulator
MCVAPSWLPRRKLLAQGVRGLSVAAVLDRAHFSTRAFYRHFESKDQLVAAVFLEVPRSEVLRVRTKMAEAMGVAPETIGQIVARHAPADTDSV